VDVCVQLVSVLSNGELRVVVDRDVDSSVADWFVIGIVELSHIRVFKGLFGGKALARVELKQVLDQVDCFVGCAGEHFSDAPHLGRWE